MIGRKVKHDSALGPVGSIRSVIRRLAQEIEVCLAKLDVDATAVRARHNDRLFLLCVE